MHWFTTPIYHDGMSAAANRARATRAWTTAPSSWGAVANDLPPCRTRGSNGALSLAAEASIRGRVGRGEVAAAWSGGGTPLRREAAAAPLSFCAQPSLHTAWPPRWVRSGFKNVGKSLHPPFPAARNPWL